MRCNILGVFTDYSPIGMEHLSTPPGIFRGLKLAGTIRHTQAKAKEALSFPLRYLPLESPDRTKFPSRSRRLLMGFKSLPSILFHSSGY